MSEDFFELRLRITQLPPQTPVADVGQNRVREGVRTDLDAVRIHLSRLIPGDGTEFFGRRLGYRHAQREGEALDHFFFQFVRESLDDRVDAFRGVAARCRFVQFEPELAFPDLRRQRLPPRLLGQKPRLVGPDPGPAVCELGDDEQRRRNSVTAQQGVGDLIGVAVAVINRDRGQAGGERLTGGYALDYSREGDDVVMRRQVFQLFREYARRGFAVIVILIGAEAMVSEDQRATA